MVDDDIDSDYDLVPQKSGGGSGKKSGDEGYSF